MAIISRDAIKNLDVKLENFFNTFTVKTKYGATAAIVTPIVILASIYIRWGYARRACKGKNKGVIYARSMSLGALHGGRLALERLVYYHHARAALSVRDEVVKELNGLLGEEHPDFKMLQSTAAKIEMWGQEDVAVDILKSKLQEVRKDGKSHEAYEIEMLLAEMYIYKGDWKKALECQCLQHEEISDARRSLYKAIIYLMQNARKDLEAKRCWEEFKGIRALFLSPESSQHSEFHKVVDEFEDFKKIVASLNRDII